MAQDGRRCIWPVWGFQARVGNREGALETIVLMLRMKHLVALGVLATGYGRILH